MKTVASLADARKMALRHGAALEVDGATFNASRARSMPPAPKIPPATTPLPVPVPVPQAAAALPTEPGLSTAEVERMMAAMDQVWRGQLDALARALDEALRAKAVPAPAPAPARLKKFNVTYDAMGRVDVVVPTYEK